jgi:hypothetical protein
MGIKSLAGIVLPSRSKITESFATVISLLFGVVFAVVVRLDVAFLVC